MTILSLRGNVSWSDLRISVYKKKTLSKPTLHDYYLGSYKIHSLLGLSGERTLVFLMFFILLLFFLITSESLFSY